MHKIYCFINGGDSGLFNVLAIADDRNVLAHHISSDNAWARHDIGITSDWKHDEYDKHFPDGYELVWLSDPSNSKELDHAAKLNAKLREQAEEQNA
jgi:hypothetical protein